MEELLWINIKSVLSTLNIFLFLQAIDYEGFKLFMEVYLEVDTPEDLCKHLFLSFVKKQEPSQTPLAGKSALGKECHVKDVALGASQTVCAPVVLQAAEQPPDNNSSNSKDKDKHHGLAEKLHGLSEKIHSLGHIRNDSSGGDSGRRSRAGTCTRTRMHSMLGLLFLLGECFIVSSQ